MYTGKITNWNEANDLLQGRNQESRKLGNNTYLHRVGGGIAIKLHDTDITTYNPDGSIILDSGGWRTITTKARINKYTGNKLSQSKGNWYFNGTPYIDGMIIYG